MTMFFLPFILFTIVSASSAYSDGAGSYGGSGDGGYGQKQRPVPNWPQQQSLQHQLNSGGGPYPPYRQPIWPPPPPPPQYYTSCYPPNNCAAPSTQSMSTMGPSTESAISSTTTMATTTSPSTPSTTPTPITSSSSVTANPITPSIGTTTSPATTSSTTTSPSSTAPVVETTPAIETTESTSMSTMAIATSTAGPCIVPANSSSIILEDASNTTSYNKNAGFYAGNCTQCNNGLATKEFYTGQFDPSPIYPQAIFLDCGRPPARDYTNLCICAENGECFRQQNAIRSVEVSVYCDEGGCHTYIEFFGGQATLVGDNGSVFNGSASNAQQGPFGTNSTQYLKAVSASCKGCDIIRQTVCN